MLNHEEDIDEKESDGLLSQPTRLKSQQTQHQGLVRGILFISVVFNILCFGFASAYWTFGKQNVKPSYENGFTSDLSPAKPEIQLTEYVFTGGIRIDKHGSYFTDREIQEYAGMPSPEVDDAWHNLLNGLNVGLDDSDANLSGKTFQWPGSREYFTGLEVFHSLHCLNRIREALYPDYYNVFDDPKNPSRRHHIGHCINHLRQAIQCHSDLTPMEWHLVGNRIILNTETRHTCRDFGKIHDWVKRKRATIHDREDIMALKNGSLFIVD